MPEKKPQRQMVDMEVVETSGVDHPAHGHEGWLVKKSAGAGRVARLDSILRGKTMPQSKEALLKEIGESKVPDSVKEFVTKSLDLTEDIEAAAALWQSLRSKAEAGDPDIPTTTDVDTPVVAAAPVAATAPGLSPDVFKSLSAAEQVALAKASEENPALAKALAAIGGVAKDALEKAATERNERLDRDAIIKSAESFKHVAMEHDKLAPALRKLSEADPATHALVVDALAKAEGQLEAAAMFGEIGTSQPSTGSDAMAKARGLAEGYVTAGLVRSIPEGIAKAFAENPSLYDQHAKES